MGCSICKGLERAFEARRSKYIAARSAAYYRVSTELAAYENVEMERAKSDFEEHQWVCFSAAKVRQSETKGSDGTSRLSDGAACWRHLIIEPVAPV